MIVRHSAVYRVVILKYFGPIIIGMIADVARRFMAPGRHGRVMLWTSDPETGLEEVTIACRLDADDDPEAHPLTVDGLRQWAQSHDPGSHWPGVEFTPGGSVAAIPSNDLSACG